LIARVASKDADLQMPPPGSAREPLTSSQIDLLRRWIQEGANYETHWAYRPLQRPILPSLDRNDWELNPIDRLVRAKHVSQNELPAPTAEPRTLLRRLSFDLHGLPPDVEELRALELDSTPAGYHRLVERLLASRRFGERMAVLWLDLVRFADTSGYHGDQHRDLWAYRDYVIDAFHRNKPFDKFTIEQIAGDLIPEATTEQLVASGYNRLLQTTEEGGAQAAEYRAIYAADRVRNVSTVWLGSTLGCAQCHDHKFDPFSTADFYRFAAFFADIKEPAVGRHEPNLSLPTPQQQTELRKLAAQIEQRRAVLTAEIQEAEPPVGVEDREASDEELQRLLKQEQALQQQVARTLVTERVEPRTTRILPRGNWLDESGPIVDPSVPEVFGHPSAEAERLNRYDLAQWLVGADNPLTARVFVNHLWQMMFGEGLVRTPEDFGAQGEYPTHPELLDWLAFEFRESGWNVKHIVRMIATSRTYQQSSSVDETVRQRDPFNRLLARQNRFRLDAEFVRDNALAVSGLLNPEVGGASVKPYQPVGYWSQLNFPKRTYEPDLNSNQYRRGLYAYWCRTFLHPGLAAFDASTREECTARRPRSNTPLQALVLLNDPSFVEAAVALGLQIAELSRPSPENAESARENGPPGDAESAGGDVLTEHQIHWAYRQVLSRDASAQELAVMRDIYANQRTRFGREPEAAKQLLTVGQQKLEELSVEDLAQRAACVSVARVLLNLHETITRP
jgi:hypothetical protein